MALKKGENGLPCRRLRSGLSEGSAEKREENMLSDGQRRWMRECYFCQKLWLLFSKDFPLMTPPHLFYLLPSFLLHCSATAFPFSPPTFPSLSVFCFVSLFFLTSFSLWVATKGWRSESDVWMSSAILSMKGEKKVTEQGAGGWGKHTEVMTTSWRGDFPFLPPFFGI